MKKPVIARESVRNGEAVILENLSLVRQVQL